MSVGGGSRGTRRAAPPLSPPARGPPPREAHLGERGLVAGLGHLEPAEDVDVPAEHATGLGVVDLLALAEDREAVALRDLGASEADVDAVAGGEEHARRLRLYDARGGVE